jgi:ParB family chromosome partitioning protein
MDKKHMKKELGQGLKALLGNIEPQLTQSDPASAQEVVRELSHAVAMIPVASIEVNPFQPRKEFDEMALGELAESLRIHGLIQPITVRALGGERYQLISGERRLRASKLAGLDAVPAYVRLANDQEMLEMALVENIQREALNPIEIAITYQRLIDECQLTHELLSGRVGKQRSSVSNYLRLLKLPPDIQKSLKQGSISMGHAKALLSIEEIGLQLSLLRETMSNDLSVRQLEELVRRYATKTSSKSNKGAKSLPQAYMDVQERMRKALSAKIQLKRNSKGKGQIVIDFSNDDDLNRLLDLIERDA